MTRRAIVRPTTSPPKAGLAAAAAAVREEASSAPANTAAEEAKAARRRARREEKGGTARRSQPRSRARRQPSSQKVTPDAGKKRKNRRERSSQSSMGSPQAGRSRPPRPRPAWSRRCRGRGRERRDDAVGWLCPRGSALWAIPSSVVRLQAVALLQGGKGGLRVQDGRRGPRLLPPLATNHVGSLRTVDAALPHVGPPARRGGAHARAPSQQHLAQRPGGNCRNMRRRQVQEARREVGVHHLRSAHLLPDSRQQRKVPQRPPGRDCALPGLAGRASLSPRPPRPQPRARRRPRRSERRRKRKKTDSPNEGWGGRTGSPPARAGFWKDDQGHRWGSPAPARGHDRLAARCTVDSQLHRGLPFELAGILLRHNGACLDVAGGNR